MSVDTCSTCRFFVDDQRLQITQCRRRSATGIGWPSVARDEWCGEHETVGQRRTSATEAPAPRRWERWTIPALCTMAVLQLLCILYLGFVALRAVTSV